MSAKSDGTRFANVEGTENPGALVTFLDARASIEGEREIKELKLAMLELNPGNRVLDVGCGTGDDAREIAALVGPTGTVVGLDASATMVAEARKRALATELSIEFIEGDALNLPFPAESFDRLRTDRVLVHLDEPGKALAEMVRVTKVGGRVVVSELDFGTQFIDSPLRQTTRKAFRSFAKRAASGWIGGALPRMLREAGLSNVRCEPRVIRTSLRFLHLIMDGHLEAPDVADQFDEGELVIWWHNLATADATGHFHNGVTIFTAVGQK